MCCEVSVGERRLGEQDYGRESHSNPASPTLLIHITGPLPVPGGTGSMRAEVNTQP